jgi:cation:H+ antiporter
MDALSIPMLFLIFTAASAVTWIAGIALAKTTDTLDTRWKIGEALGGLILLGITGSLPEMAVVYAAARHGDIPVITGNLIGGIAIQTLLIVIFDYASGKTPLSFLAGSIELSVETLFAIGILVFALLGAMTPARDAVFNMNPFTIVIVVAWVLGLFIINKIRMNPKYNKVEKCEEEVCPARGRTHSERRKVENHVFYAGKSTLHVGLIFLVASIATLIAGYLLEETGTRIATHFNIGSALFAATVIALVTALPEISTGIESIWIGDNHLAISDIMGGNAFMLVIFLLADLVAKKPVLSFASSDKVSMLFAYAGVIMMAVYAISFIRKIRKGLFRLGLDSVLEIILYAVALVIMVKLI